METKQVKLRVHPKTFYEDDFIVNTDVLSRDRFKVQVGDIVEISAVHVDTSQNEAAERPRLFLQVEYVPQEIQSKGGPLSVSKEVAQAFNLDGVREVIVRRVERDEVALDLVELRFKDQCLTRSDMWRFTCSLAGRFVHLSKKLEHSGIRSQVYKLWSFDGSRVTSGAIVNKTRVVFRSASVKMFLFIQISSEMWDFDPSGDLYFDKAISGFLKELFQRWKDESCNHEVTLVFFWRTFYDQPTFEQLSPGVQSSVQRDKRGRFYEDFYRVIVAGESLTDWSCKLVDIKKHFAHLRETVTKTRGEGARISSSAEGNFLEAINMAVNVFQKHYVDCNFSMTGQQVVIVTAGVGVFEVDHNLTRLTKERIIDGGVGADLVCLTEQPLHAVPLFRFQNSDTLDDSEYYHIPHWINYSFYSPPHSRNRFRFQPRLQLSDHLVNEHLNREGKKSKGTKLYNPFSVDNASRRTSVLEDRFLNRIDLRDDAYAMYDGSIFSTGSQGIKNIFSMSKVQSSGKLHSGSSSTRTMSAKVLVRHHSHDESTLGPASPGGAIFMAGGVSFDDDKNTDPFEGPDQYSVGLSVSPGSRSTKSMQSDMRKSSKEGLFTVSLHPGSLRSRVHSDEIVDSSVTSGRGFTAGSAESLRQFYLPRPPVPGKGLEMDQTLVSRKKRTFINPFDPSRLHADLTAYHRRWMHVFPRNKNGVAFQIHHVIPEEPLAESSDSDHAHSLQSSNELGDSPYDHALRAKRGEGQQSDGSGDRLSQRSSGSLKNQDRNAHKKSPRTDASVSQTSNMAQTSNLSSTSGIWMKNVSGLSPNTLQVRENYYSDPNTQTTSKNSLTRPKPQGKTDVRSGREHSDVRLNCDYSDSSDVRSSSLLSKRTQVFTVGKMSSQNVDLKNENFASARRLGTDWPSLTEPACLPVTTDFFPSNEKLTADFFEYPTKLVASTFSYGSGESTGEKTTPSWITDHQDVSTFQVYSEMISQRVSQGFQLVIEPKPGRSGSEESLFSLYHSLKELNEMTSQTSAPGSRTKKKRRFQDVSVKLSLGRVFQKVELNYPDLIIWIYRPKLREDTDPVSSTYQLSTAMGGATTPTTSGNDTHSEGEGFTTCHTKFGFTGVEEYNWNYLDQHICGYSDFEELGESQKYWRCRYLLLPSGPLDVEVNSLGQGEGSEEALISSFVRFLEFLNHVKRGGQGGSKPGSKQGSLQGVGYKRQSSLPVSASSSRVPTPNESHSNISSPFTIRGSHKLTEIGEERPGTPKRSTSSPHHPVPDNGLRVSDTSRSRPRSPYLGTGTSHPKSGSSEPRKPGIFVSASNTDLLSLDGKVKSRTSDRERKTSKENDSSTKRVKHRRTSSHDYSKASSHTRSKDDLSTFRETDDHKLATPHKTKGSPQLLRRTAVEESTSHHGSRQDLSFGSGSKKESSSSTNSSPNHTPKHSRVGVGKRSPDTSLPVEVTPPTPSDGVPHDISVDTLSSSFYGVEVLSSSSPLQFIAEAMANTEDGIDFLGQLPGVGTSCFVAMEAVTWAMDRVSGVNSRREAVKILQNMVSEQLVIHASRDFKIPFVDGYFLYYLPMRDNQEGIEPPKESMERSFILVAEMDFEKFSKRWFEVKIHHPSSYTDREGEQSTLSGFGISPSSMSPFPTSFQAGRNSNAYYMHFEGKEGLEVPASMLNRYVELNPDPQGRSDRPEWFYVRYDHTYHPRCAFQLEFQWMVATMNLLHQLIQSWLYKATMCGFNLVPAPMLQTLSQDRGVSAHPFQQQYFIPLKLPATFPGWSDSEAMYGLSFNVAMHKLFDAIISKFGFLLDPASLPQDSDVLSPQYESPSFTSHFYIHYSGAALVQPVCEVDREQTVGPSQVTGDKERDTVPHSSAVDINSGGVSRHGRGTQHSGQFSVPIGSSTPVHGSPSDSLWLPRRGSVNVRENVKCGFYWYKNNMFLRQKNTSTSVHEQYDKLLSQLAGFCSDESMSLSELCSETFSDDND